MVDKNRAWLHCIELLLHIEPGARLIVCLRECRHEIPARIQAQIESACDWYYQMYYPGRKSQAS